MTQRSNPKTGKVSAAKSETMDGRSIPSTLSTTNDEAPLVVGESYAVPKGAVAFIDAQNRVVQKRWLVDAFAMPLPTGAYMIVMNPDDYSMWERHALKCGLACRLN